MPDRYEIEIADEQAALPLDESAIRSTVETLLRLESVETATLSIAVVDDPTIHVLNREHLRHDYPTDVLSFALHDPPESTDGRAADIDGEVVVSSDTAIARAVEFRWSAHDELLLYIVHGLLHIVGYDDRTPSQRAEMRSRERAVLRERGLHPRYHGDEDDTSPPSEGGSDESLPPGEK